jgi:hypothetical protein
MRIMADGDTNHQIGYKKLNFLQKNNEQSELYSNHTLEIAQSKTLNTTLLNRKRQTDENQFTDIILQQKQNISNYNALHNEQQFGEKHDIDSQKKRIKDNISGADSISQVIKMVRANGIQTPSISSQDSSKITR